MKLCRFALSFAAAACLLTAGCATPHNYYVASPPPPPGYNSVPPMIERADHEGFRDGSEDGARDAYNRYGHHPQRDHKFHDTPGYDPAMGPYRSYRDAFRNSYLRGYDQAYYRR
jgi:hypothetical protein